MTNVEYMLQELTGKRHRALQALEGWTQDADPYSDRIHQAQDLQSQLYGAWRVLHYLGHSEAEAVKAMAEEVEALLTHLLNS
jgi:hypothetical protein